MHAPSTTCRRRFLAAGPLVDGSSLESCAEGLRAFSTDTGWLDALDHPPQQSIFIIDQPIIHQSLGMPMAPMPLRTILAVVMSAGLVLSAAQAATPSCSWPSVNATACASYFTGSSPKPTAECCTELHAILNAQAPCACAALQGGPGPMASTLNQTLVYAVASLCGMPDNPCNDVNFEAPTSSIAPTASTPMNTVATAPAPAAATAASNSAGKGKP